MTWRGWCGVDRNNWDGHEEVHPFWLTFATCTWRIWKWPESTHIHTRRLSSRQKGEKAFGSQCLRSCSPTGSGDPSERRNEWNQTTVSLVIERRTSYRNARVHTLIMHRPHILQWCALAGLKALHRLQNFLYLVFRSSAASKSASASSSKHGMAFFGTAPGSVVMARKWQYMAYKLRVLKQTMWKQPAREYPNHGLMTENWIRRLEWKRGSKGKSWGFQGLIVNAQDGQGVGGLSWIW